MRPLPMWALFALILLVAGSASAQGQSAAAAARYREVERGFWVGTDVGAVIYFQLPGEGSSAASGALMGFQVGYDLLPSLQLSAVAWGQAVGADVEYKGVVDPVRDPRGARGDFQSLLLGGSLKWSFLRFDDENGIGRTWLYARGGGGSALSRPEGVVADGTWASGALGVEYFTRLRHFSVGLETGWLGLFTEDGAAHGVSILPRLKYTF